MDPSAINLPSAWVGTGVVTAIFQGRHRYGAHLVDEVKRQKIVATNIPCIEIDITKFQVRGRVTL